MKIPDSNEWQVPVYSKNVFGEKKTKYCIVIPVINEGERIRQQLETMHDIHVHELVDIVIADGGSTDGSLEDGFLQSVGVRGVLEKLGPGKLSAQLRMAYAWALQEGYEGIITIDGNGKDSVGSIAAFVDALDAGVDYAQASRFIKGGKGINTPPIRLWAIKLIHAPLVSLAARHWFTDTTQGFRAYSAKYLLHPEVKPFRDVFMVYELLAYLSVRASRIGLKVKEVPTTRIYPSDGHIPTKISSFKGNFNLIRTLLKLLAGDYNPE